MTKKDECRAISARRLRKTRLWLGYKTAASFARAIGYPADKYSRYERQGFVNSGPMLQLIKAIENAGFGLLSIEWLFDLGPIWYVPPAKTAIKPAVRTEGNVVHANFAR